MALGLRAVAVTRTAAIFNDGPIFIRLAGLMHGGQWSEALSHPYHPLYSFLIHLVRYVIPDPETAGILLSLLAGSAAVVALYYFLREAFDETVARVGASLLLLNPYAVRFSADVQSDSVYLFLFLSSVSLLFRALRAHSASLALWAGLGSGLAYLTRPEGAGVVVVGCLLAGVAWLRGSWSASRTLGWVAALVGGLAAAAVPYLAAIRSVTGRWSFSQKKSILSLLGFDLEGFELPVGEAIAGGLGDWLLAPLLVALGVGLYLGWRGLDQLRGNAATRVRVGAGALAGTAGALAALALWLAPQQVVFLAAIVVSTLRPEVLLLLAVGIGVRAAGGPQGRSLFISVFSALYGVVLFGLLLHYGYLSRRHALPPLTLLLGYAALGATALAAALAALPAKLGQAETRLGRWSGTAWLALLLLGVAAISLPKTLSDYRSEEVAGRRAAEWLRLSSEGPGLLAANRSKLGYYAGREWFPLRHGGALVAPEELMGHGVRYLILEEDALTEGLAAAPSLAGSQRVRLRELHRVQARGRNAVVFELTPGGAARLNPGDSRRSVRPS